MLIIQSHDYTLLLPLECSHITQGLVLVPKNVCVCVARQIFFSFWWWWRFMTLTHIVSTYLHEYAAHTG